MTKAQENMNKIRDEFNALTADEKAEKFALSVELTPSEAKAMYRPVAEGAKGMQGIAKNVGKLYAATPVAIRDDADKLADTLKNKGWHLYFLQRALDLHKDKKHSSGQFEFRRVGNRWFASLVKQTVAVGCLGYSVSDAVQFMNDIGEQSEGVVIAIDRANADRDAWVISIDVACEDDAQTWVQEWEVNPIDVTKKITAKTAEEEDKTETEEETEEDTIRTVDYVTNMVIYAFHKWGVATVGDIVTEAAEKTGTEISEVLETLQLSVPVA